MADFVNVFADSTAPPGTDTPSSSGFVNVFETSSQSPQQVSPSGPITGLEDFFSNNIQNIKDMVTGGVKTAFPVASTIADVYPKVEPVVRPVVQAPVTGIGGLIDLAQGNSVQDAAAGIKAGKTAGDYLKEQIPDTETTSLWANIAGNLGKVAAGFATDSGIYTGLTEGLIGQNVKPRINVNLDPSVPPESPALSRQFDAETTAEPMAEAPKAETFKNVFESQAPKDKGFVNVFDENQSIERAAQTIKEVPDNPVTYLKDAETPEQFRLRIRQELEGAFKKGLEAQDESVDEPIQLGETLRHEPELSPKEQNAINSESGHVLNPQEAQSTIAKKFDTAGAYSPVAEAKAERFGNIQVANFEDEQAIRSIVDKLTPTEEKALALTQSGRIPKSWQGTEEGKQIASLLADPSPALAEAQVKMQAFTDKALSELKPIFPEMGALKKYFPDAWDLDKAPSNLKGGFSTDNPYTHMRTIPDRAQGMDMGLTPKFERPGDALRQYSRFKNQSIENNVLLDKLTEIKTPEGSPMRKTLINNKTNETYSNPDIPLSYVDGGKISPLWNGYKFPPEMAKELAFMKSIEVGKWEARYALGNATLKKMALNMSFFHHITLSESSIAAQGIGRTLKAVGKIPAALRAGGATHIMPELAKDALQHNLVLGGIEADVQQGLVEQIAEQIDKGISFAAKKLSGKDFDSELMSKALKPVGKLEEYWDKALWSAYHPTIKLMAYENLVSNALREFPNSNPDMVKRQIADFVNSSMGGQAWELVFQNPRVKRGFNHLFLALDWTSSNLRSAEALFENGPKGYVARKYWLNMGLLLFASAEMINGLNKKAQTGKWDWTWNNDPGHKGDVWLYKDRKGMNHYITLNKGAHEPIRWFTEPKKELAGKLAPVLQIIWEQLSGHSSTGYDLDFAKPGNSLKAIANHAAPMSMSGNSFLGAFPTSQGISFTKLKSELETAIYKKDTPKIKELIHTAQNNGINGAKVYNQIKAQIKGKEKYEKQRDNQSGPTAEVINRLSKKVMGVSLGELAQSEFDKIKNKLREKKK